MPFRDRKEAGRRLADKVLRLRNEQPVVLGLPRGGVPVAYELARALDAPLDVVVVRKLGVPFQPELGMGAIGENGVRILNEEVLRYAQVSTADLARVEARERVELERRARRFRSDRPPVSIEGRTAIVVDDGLATGSTARAALQVVRAHGAARIVLAVPVAPPETVRSLEGIADTIVTLETPAHMVAIGAWYADFTQTSDDEVVALLDAAHRFAAPPPSPSGGNATAGSVAEVAIPAGTHTLPGRLSLPPGSTGLIVFAHGSGSSRHSPRNRLVAGVLEGAGLGTLLFDLLTEEEAADRANVFDIGLLADRLTDAVRWTAAQPPLERSRIGAFGASTGAAAALWAAAEPGSPIAAVVSRGGRPDLAAPRLGAVRAPTLLVVGGADTAVLQLNREAATHLRCEHRLAVVPGATHLFEEPGTLEAAAELARGWFLEHLVPTAAPTG